MHPDLLYQLALSFVPTIGDVRARALVNHYGDAASVFKAKKKELEQVEGINCSIARAIKKFDDFALAEAEIKFIEQYHITPLFITDSNYPQRLLNCYDCPLLLYYRGNADLNASRILAIVGTRNNAEYGRIACENIIQGLAAENILVISGLAVGIDTIAHRAAIKNDLHTVGVLAHGLDRIYPSFNKNLAKQMLDQGGLLTDFPSNTKPDKQNFPKRNRIVAGMCDALIVIESEKKGGSLITAELANGYNKDVFALPGKITDIKSEGCNYLIQHNKASLLTNTTDLLEMLGWKARVKKNLPKQTDLFPQLSIEERQVYDLLKDTDGLPIDTLLLKSGLSNSKVASALLMLELKAIVGALPGKIYKLL